MRNVKNWIAELSVVVLFYVLSLFAGSDDDDWPQGGSPA